MCVMSEKRQWVAIPGTSAIVLIVVQRILAAVPRSVGLEILVFSFPGALFGHSSGRYYQAIELLSLGSVLVLSSRGVVGRSAVNDSAVPLEVVGHCISGFFPHFGVLVRVSESGILSRVTPLSVSRQGAHGDDVVDSKSRGYKMLCRHWFGGLHRMIRRRNWRGISARTGAFP